MEFVPHVNLRIIMKVFSFDYSLGGVLSEVVTLIMYVFIGIPVDQLKGLLIIVCVVFTVERVTLTGDNATKTVIYQFSKTTILICLVNKTQDIL